MARPGLTQHRKFRRLEKALGSHIIARGALETLWDVAYQNGDPYLGDSGDVEAAAHWNGEGKPGQLTKALLEAGGDSGPGFIEEIPDKPGHYAVHDLFHHAPLYVSKRRTRELGRRQNKTCAHCGTSYRAADPRSRYCTPACKTAAWREANRVGKGECDEPVTDSDGHVSVTNMRNVTDVTECDGQCILPVTDGDRNGEAKGTGKAALGKPRTDGDRPVTECDTTPAPAPHIKAKPSSKPQTGFDQSLQACFKHYLKATEKNPKLYKLTPLRRRKGEGRLRQCYHLASEPKLENAVALFKVAIDRFASSPFHNGQNEQGKRYLDWELLCRSDEKFTYWLDDKNFPQAVNQ